MDVGNPQDWQQGAGALKAGIEALSSAWKLVKEFRSSGKPGEAEEAVVESALIEAGKAAKIAEAQIAKALGYELCRCEFPPTAMLTVGTMTVHGKQGEAKMVHECPKCGVTTAGPWGFNRSRPLENSVR